LLAFEHGVIDRDVGEVVFNVPRSGIEVPGKRFPIDESHLTVIDVGKNAASVLVYGLPEDKIAKATERIASRVERRDEPPSTIGRVDRTTRIDESQARLITPNAKEWRVSPDARTVSAGGAQPLQLRPSTGSVAEFAVSGGARPMAAILRTNDYSPWMRIPKGNVDPQHLQTQRSFVVKEENPFEKADGHRAGSGSGKSRSWLDFYDLSSGKVARNVRLAYDSDLVGISPDGSRVLLWAAVKPDRLDVYNTASGTLTASWEPGSRSWAADSFLTGASLIDDERAYTLNSNGDLELWKITGDGPDAQITKLLGLREASQPSVSPTGKYLGYSDGQSYHLIDVEAGEEAGKIPDVGDVQGAAFHPTQGRLALISEYKGGYYLFAVDLDSGEVSPPFPSPVVSPYLQWCGERYLLLDNRKLVDVEQKVVAWSYDLPEGGEHLPGGPDGRHWFLTKSQTNAQSRFTLSAVELPTSDALSQLSGAVLEPEFLLQPGGKCSLSLQLGPISGYATDAQKLLTDALKQHNISVEQNQPVTLQVTITESVNGTVEQEFVPMGSFGGGDRQKVSYPRKSARCSAQFVSGGAVAWEFETTLGNGSFFVSTPKGQSIVAAIEQSYQSSLRGFFNRIVLPPFVFTPKAANGLGTTTLAAGG
jgi:hypothetical protein